MSVIEKTIEYFAPRSALKRKAAKIRLRSIEAASRKPRIALPSETLQPFKRY